MADVFDVADGFGPTPKSKILDLVCNKRKVRVELKIALKQTHLTNSHAGQEADAATAAGAGGGGRDGDEDGGNGSNSSGSSSIPGP